MRRPARWLVTNTREAPGNTALPPLRAERANALREAQERQTTLHPLCNAHRLYRGGLGAKKSPRWSAERRASPGCADCVSWFARGREGERSKARSRASSTRYALRAYVIGPRRVPRKHPGACRRSAPSFVARGKPQTSEDDLPRENDDVCRYDDGNNERPGDETVRCACDGMAVGVASRRHRARIAPNIAAGFLPWQADQADRRHVVGPGLRPVGAADRPPHHAAHSRPAFGRRREHAGRRAHRRDQPSVQPRAARRHRDRHGVARHDRRSDHEGAQHPLRAGPLQLGRQPGSQSPRDVRERRVRRRGMSPTCSSAN